jgi:hypothetical protein
MAMLMYQHLVGGLEPWNFMTFHSVGNVIFPTDELIIFRGVGSTTNQTCSALFIFLCVGEKRDSSDSSDRGFGCRQANGGDGK